MNDFQIKNLISAALEARRASYSPYSGFSVGAALLTASGEIFGGCNVEVGGHSATCCAERTAIFKAVSQGYRDFTAIAVTGGPDSGPVAGCYPCGVCRQAMAEFCNDDFIVIVAVDDENWRKFHLKELMPYRFDEGEVNL